MHQLVVHFFVFLLILQAMPKQTQIIHDMFQIKGGGERLVIAMCQGLDTDLLTAHIGPNTFDLSQINGDVINLDALSRIHGIKTWRLAKAFKNLKTEQNCYEQIIYSGVASPLAVHHFPTAKNIFYCHTPPRFVYDKKSYYADGFNPLKRMAFNLLVNWFKPQYEKAIKQMDVVLTNSHYVQARIKSTTGLDAAVIHPPCDTHRFKWIAQGDYYLSMARHDDLKRIDSIIKAFLKMPDKKLIIASGGGQTDALKRIAGNAKNISFTGWLNEAKMMSLLGNCLATIYVPLDEDFGMTPVESMSAGKPVICSNHGGLLETVIDGVTGYFVSSENLVNDIIQKVNLLSNNHQASLMRSACEERAGSFDTQLFLKKLKEFL
ncbi:glycosyltransferase involved in cell wall biosynthesis [Marinicella litoralis]|uniref:Glycosyltransferase involved in cell wall biosynthesis n=2 Tax=Marinicella litoralis TaxID=644220 RepID=A0A4R6XVT0_9GAMM|nr:glycosyltransferase involved in cell wall biosynthesis [Marinicella litoralis]